MQPQNRGHRTFAFVCSTRSAVRIVPFVLLVLLCTALLPALDSLTSASKSRAQEYAAAAGKPELTWVDFDVTANAMQDALSLMCESRESETPLDWIDLLACLGAHYGGDFRQYKPAHLQKLAQRLREGETLPEITAGLSSFGYYRLAYEYVLGGLAGEYRIQTAETIGSSHPEMQLKYGLKGYSPIAWGYAFSHYDDFGTARSYGFRRTHLGNDLLGAIGTPVVAVESGRVETMGWNQYGGWRIGIRSLDERRYYYYAHLRRGRPYAASLREGDLVQAGDVIGYLGMTGYSTTEDVNGMSVPHLHFGLQLVPEGTERECENEIWVDVYELVKFLEHHKSPVLREDATKEYYRKYAFEDPLLQAARDAALYPAADLGRSGSFRDARHRAKKPA